MSDSFDIRRTSGSYFSCFFEIGNSLIFYPPFGVMIRQQFRLILNRFGIDPAIASGPFISTANDISALLIYFGVTIAFVGMSS